jgi:hypothetical protein
MSCHHNYNTHLPKRFPWRVFEMLCSDSLMSWKIWYSQQYYWHSIFFKANEMALDTPKLHSFLPSVPSAPGTPHTTPLRVGSILGKCLFCAYVIFVSDWGQGEHTSHTPYSVQLTSSHYHPKPKVGLLAWQVQGKYEHTACQFENGEHKRVGNIIHGNQLNPKWSTPLLCNLVLPATDVYNKW